MEDLIVEILKNLSLSAVFFLLGAYVVFTNPEKAKIWISYIFVLLSKLNSKYAIHATQNDIEGRINTFNKKLQDKIANFDPIGVKIVWANENISKEDFFKENKFVIVIEDTGNLNKNFVNATMIYLSKATLITAKRYLAPYQKESIDLYIATKIFEEEKPQVIEQFFNDYLSPQMESKEKISELMSTFNTLDKAGLFFPVYISELIFLGQKVFHNFGKKTEEILREVKELTDFLKSRSLRQIGDMKTPSVFEGNYCSCAIVIVGTVTNRINKPTETYLRYIDTLINKKIDNIYLIGPIDKENDNVSFINTIGSKIEELYFYGLNHSKKYPCLINTKEGFIRSDSYLAMYRNPNVLHIYDARYMEQHIEPYVNDIKIKEPFDSVE